MSVKRLRSGGLFAAMLLAACDSGSAPEKAAPSPENEAPRADADAIPTGRLSGAVVPSHYRLDLTIVPDRDRFSGAVAIDVTLEEARDTIFLHGNKLSVDTAYLTTDDGGRIDATYQQVHETGVARLALADTAEAGQATLHFQYSAPFNRSLEGLYHVADGGEDYAFTQFEATSARLAFPSFDEPAFKQPFDISVTAKADHRVITTTPEVERTELDNGLVKRIYATTEPLPTYLIAFAVGPLDVVEAAPLPPTDVRDRPIPLRGVAAKGKGDQLAYALENTRGILEALESYFDTPYPYAKLDIIAVPDFAAGAMENVGAITYREQYLLLGDGSTASPRLKQFYARVHAHELAHQWFGNLVTPVWWNDIWLNESFATWMGNKAVDAWRPGEGYGNLTLRGMLGVMDSDSLVTARQIRNPIESNHDIATAFDGITYRKGGGVLEMVESFLGEEAFRKGVRLHMERFAHDVADVNDFMKSLADGADRPDIVPAFESFLYQKGVPLVSTSVSCDGNGAAVSVSQSRYLPLGSDGDRDQTWGLPLCMAYGLDGDRAKTCALVSQADATPVTIDQGCPDWVMPNAGGAGYYRWTLESDGWQALFDHFAALNVRERLSMADSISAGYKADTLSTETLSDAARILAGAEAREVVLSPIDDLERLHRLARTDAARAGVEGFVRSLYTPVLERIGLEPKAGEAPDTALMRAPVVAAVAELGRDSALRTDLTQRAARYLGYDRESGGDKTALPPGLEAVALRVAVREKDDAFARWLLAEALDSRDGTFRGRALGALAQAKSPEIATLMRETALKDSVRNNEAEDIIFDMADVPAHHDAVWSWLQDDATFKAFVARIPKWNQGAVTELGTMFCSADKRATVQAFFAPRVEDLEGGPRLLDQTLERISLCAALKQAKADAVTAHFGEG